MEFLFGIIVGMTIPIFFPSKFKFIQDKVLSIIKSAGEKE